MKGACECGNEPPGSIKCREFLRLACQEGLSFMELVTLMCSLSPDSHVHPMVLAQGTNDSRV